MIRRFFRWLLAAPASVVVLDAPAPATRSSFFTTDAVDVDPVLTRTQRLENTMRAAMPSTKLRVVNTQTGAVGMDMAECAPAVKALTGLNQVGVPEAQMLWYGSQGFIGYQMCALLAQQWLINKACLVPARDAIRKGYEFAAPANGKVSAEALEAVKDGNKRYRLNRALIEFVKMGRVFGIRIAMFVVESSDPEYYVKPFNADGIEPGSYRGISQIDPYWCIPELSNRGASNPAAIDFYDPTYWVIEGKRYHKSHLVIMRGPEVADILKPSYLYGGLSVPQLIYERVYAAERTANEAPQLALTKRSTIFYTDTAKALANQGAFEEKMSVWRSFLDNFGIKVADKEADKIEQHDTSLADLDNVIMSQYQLVAAIANVPATKLLGTTPKGFNSSGSYEEDSYHEELESIQTELEPLIDRHVVCMIRSDIAPRFGVEPFGLSVKWNPLATMTAIEKAALNKTKAETDKIYAVDIGAVDGDDVRKRLDGDKESGYAGLGERVSQDVDDGEAA